MDILQNIRDKAKAKPVTLCLPEGEDERVVAAGAQALDLGYAREVVLLARDRAAAEAAAAKAGAALTRFTLVEPAKDPAREQAATAYYELRKHKGMTPEEAAKIMTAEPFFFGAWLLRTGAVDAVVGGAATSTGTVMRAALHVVGLAPGCKTLSTCFIMLLPKPEFGDEGVMFWADPALVVDPTPEQLADIAVATAENYRLLVGLEPRVAMLSFSTKGSAEHPLIDEVRRATALVKQRSPNLVIDGEMQADAAIVPAVAAKKAPGSPIQGNANVLIFPALEAANISYKLVERIAGARAVGPFSQGLAKPYNDLSRGVKVPDLVDTIAVTVARVV